MHRVYYILFVLITLVLSSCHQAQKEKLFSAQQKIISSDIANFWKAHDTLQQVGDSVHQMNLLKTEFIDKASVGQRRMMAARRYTPDEYINSITNRTSFWNSIRPNTERIDVFNTELRKGVDQLAKIYPDLRHATIYYTVGNHRSPGTGMDSVVLIGTEFALGDSSTIVHELPEYNQSYYAINPITHLSFLCVHEYVHTQQKPMVHDLLSLTLYEGIAEFVAITATGQQSPWKAFSYGPENEEKIIQRFEEDMFKPSAIYNWLWNSPQNEFGTSDLSYFVGYQLASRYYDAATDKMAAIKSLIELDYTNEVEIEKLVNSTGYFSRSVSQMRSNFEQRRPIVIGIQQFENHSASVNPSLREITIEFSEVLDGMSTSVDFGELGKDAFPQGTFQGRRWGVDNKSWTIPVDLEPNRRYQILISSNFRTQDGIPLKPFLIDFTTRK